MEASICSCEVSAYDGTCLTTEELMAAACSRYRGSSRLMEADSDKTWQLTLHKETHCCVPNLKGEREYSTLSHDTVVH